jgi:tRNA(Glu) U13 pseudouridine synthase TruD
MPIRSGLKEHVDYVIISKDMWEIFTHLYEHYCFKRFLSEGLDGKKVEVYLFEELKNFEVVQLQLPQYKPLSKDFLEVLSKHVRELVVEINNNPAGISGSYTSYNNFSKDNIEMWIL